MDAARRAGKVWFRSGPLTRLEGLRAIDFALQLEKFVLGSESCILIPKCDFWHDFLVRKTKKANKYFIKLLKTIQNGEVVCIANPNPQLRFHNF